MPSTTLYNEERLKRLKKRYSWSLTGLIVLLVISVSYSITLCFFITDETYVWIILALSVGLVLLSWGFVYLLTAILLPLVASFRIAQAAKDGNKETFEGVVLCASKKRTPARHVEATLVELQTAEGRRDFYYEDALGPLNLKEGERVRIEEVAHFITGFEVILG